MKCPNICSQFYFHSLDLDVPKEDGKILNNHRIVAALPTILYLIRNGAKSVIIMSHLGRPGGHFDQRLSLEPVARELARLFETEVMFLPDCVGPEVEETCSHAAYGSVVMLENVRFHIEETGQSQSNDGRISFASKEEVEKFRDSLSKLGDVFVNDAFGTSHRSYSSMVGIRIPTRAAGLLMAKELDTFDQILSEPKKPFLAILGGAKIEDKILMIDNLLDKVTHMIIGGGMAFTFLRKLHGMEIGSSLFDEKGFGVIDSLMAKAKARNIAIYLPIDFLVGDRFTRDCNVRSANLASGIEDGWMGMDIGPETAKSFGNLILQSATIIWNGPMGVFEWEPFESGSRRILEAIAKATDSGAVTVVAGGDTAACCFKFGFEDRVRHISTGGGASLQLLEGRSLPAVEFLTDA